MATDAPGEGFDVVTGAFGQTGHAIARRLLDQGRRVHTVTRAPPQPGSRVVTVPPMYQDPERLTAALRGCDTLYSTLWSRFPVGGTYDGIVRDASVLFACARAAGVRRIVQVTVAHAQDAAAWDLPYWRGKHHLEEALRASSVPHSILRPALIFGLQDTLVNNLAWFMRRLHVVPSVRDTRARIRPVFVDDLAGLAVTEAGRGTPSAAVDAVGPESLSYAEFLAAIAAGVGKRAAFPRLPPRLVWLLGLAWSPMLSDTLLSWAELQSLRRGLLDVDGPATCPTAFTTWMLGHGGNLGRHYRSQRRRAAGRDYPGRL